MVGVRRLTVRILARRRRLRSARNAACSVFAAAGRLYVVGGCTVDLHDTQVVESRPL